MLNAELCSVYFQPQFIKLLAANYETAYCDPSSLSCYRNHFISVLVE